MTFRSRMWIRVALSRPISVSSKHARGNHTMSMIYRPVKTLPQGKEGKEGQGGLSKSLRLLMDYGFIRPSSCPGAMHYLPLGLRSLEKLVRIIDKFMQDANCQKIQMPTLTSEALWRTTGRIDECSTELMALSDRHSKRLLLSPTHEEAVCDLVAGYPLTHRQLPLRLYQITDKFRDEKRPRFGLMRGRQFLMKDLYTFDKSKEDAQKTYEEVISAYENLFTTLGLRWRKVIGSTGTIGGEMSHEFHLNSEVGEDNVFHCHSCQSAFNSELVEAVKTKMVAASGSAGKVQSGGGPACINCGSTELSSSKSIEIGHAFLLGRKYTEPFQVTYVDSSNANVLMEMGCYGIGVSRLLAAMVEVLSIDNEIRWPVSVAPYFLSILPPKMGSKEEVKGKDFCESFLTTTKKILGNDVIVDDRIDQTVGRRLMDAKKLGIPYIAVFGKSLLNDPSTIELQNVNTNETHSLSFNDATKLLYDAKAAANVQ